jgi:hypothetical protein
MKEISQRTSALKIHADQQYQHQNQKLATPINMTTSVALEPNTALESLMESRSITVLRQNLAKFESKLMVDNQVENLPNVMVTQKNDLDEDNKHIFVNLDELNANKDFFGIKKVITNINDIKFNFDDTHTTTSNTLIDADSSFDSIKLDMIKQSHNLKDLFSKPQPPAVVVTNYNNDRNTNNEFRTLQQSQTNLKNQFVATNQRQPNCEHHIYAPQFNDDDEDEDEKIIISMNDLSITTIQMSNSTSSSASSNNPNQEESIESRDDESMRSASLVISTNCVHEVHVSTTLNNNNEMTPISINMNNTSTPAKSQSNVMINAITCSNINTIYNNMNKVNSTEDDYQFQENLKKLDQKIFKVKQMLESMKSNDKQL